MLQLKTPHEIELMRQAGQKLAKIRQQLLEAVKPGVTGLEIEALAQKLIKQAGASPSFSRVPNYDWATCINLNQGIVHGVPNQIAFQAGDLVSIDVGLYWQGFHSDCSRTIYLLSNQDSTKVAKLKRRFLDTGARVLNQAIKAAKPGHRVGHISQAIETGIRTAGYAVIPHLTGHGIGRELHQLPHIPGVVNQPIKQTPLLEPGLTIAVEVIYALTTGKTVVSSEDNWTVETKDGKIAAIFEETIAILNDGPLILTKI